ncbi:MAG: thioredoxin [Saprospiraceae bacterium]|nr:thioredoxin [Saprospiraceae bacterium]
MKYQDIINSETPTLVDFSAEWCGPCKAMAPILKQLAGKIGEKAKIIKIDVDKNQALASKLQIKGVPTFILYKKGNIVWRDSGMQSLSQLEKLIDQATDK